MFPKALYGTLLLALSVVVGACSDSCPNCPEAGEYLRFTADGKQLTMGSLTATDTLVDIPPTIQRAPGGMFWALGIGIDGLAYDVTLLFPQELGTLPFTMQVDWDTSSTIVAAAAIVGWVEPRVRGYFTDKVTGSITITESTASHMRGTFELHEVGHVGFDENTFERKDVPFDVTNGEFYLKVTDVTL